MGGKENPSGSGGPSLALGMSKIPLNTWHRIYTPIKGGRVSSRVEDLNWRKSDRTE